MQYRWQIDSHLEIYARRPARRYLVQTLGGQFPVLQKLHDGTIACVARGGDFHVGERGYLTWTTSTDGGESWDFARPLGPFGLDDRGPCFIQTREGTLLIAFQNGPFYENCRYSARLQRTEGTVQLVRSGDLGRSWEHTGRYPQVSATPSASSRAVRRRGITSGPFVQGSTQVARRATSSLPRSIMSRTAAM
jgi:hypothetical protein